MGTGRISLRKRHIRIYNLKLATIGKKRKPSHAQENPELLWYLFDKIWNEDA